MTIQLLAFARKQIINPEIVSLNTLITLFQPFLRQLIGEDIDLRITLHPGLWKVKIDLNQFEQIILNLAVNARDSMRSGSKLIIETTLSHLDESYNTLHPNVHPGHYAMLAISDTGNGMDKETVQHIWNRSSQRRGLAKVPD
ncbi:MAG: hypothetical protein V1799_14820 [bacterium]